MNEIDLGAHLRSIEEALMDPEVRRDRAQVAALLTEDFREFGSSGRAWGREEILDALAANREYIRPIVEDFRCESIADGIALVTYRTVSPPLAGESSVALRSSLWVREGGKWRIRFHQGTLGGNLSFRK